jgi:hypothetical protein
MASANSERRFALALKPHIRAWYLITASLVPPLWASSDWHGYTHIAGGSLASYLALLVSPAVFVIGALRLFEPLRGDRPGTSA